MLVSPFPPFAPVTPQAGTLRSMLWITLGVSAVIFVVVVTMLVVGVWRYRASAHNQEGTKTVSSVKLETVWTVIPLLIVIGLFVLTVRAMHSVDPSPPPGRRPDVRVIAHQWWWEVRYPGTEAVTANEIHVPTGKRLLLEIESADVIHDFWAPRLTRKIDAVPGHPNHVWMEVDQPGVYHGACAEFCGAQHAHMQFEVVAESPAQYRAWLQKQAEPANPPRDTLATAGMLQFLGTGMCGRCHTIRGAEADENIGPDLTHVGGRRTLAADMLPNDAGGMYIWLKDPGAVKPGVNMPDLHLSNQQILELVAYLEGLK